MTRVRHGDLVAQQRGAGVALVAPALVALVGISVVPLFLALGFSFTDYSLIGTTTWVGLGNYVSILSDPVYWEAIRNTLVFAASQVGVGIVVVVLVAALFNGHIFGGNMMRTIIYMPQAASYVVVALIWNLLLDPFVGPINAVLASLRAGPVYFLSDPQWVIASIVVVSMWRNLGYFMIIVLAGLKSVPRELLEAAEIDGANAPQRFLLISLPMIKPVLSFVAITWFLGALQMFTQSYVMTGGGPMHASRTIVFLMYDEAFTNLNIGRASAMSVLLFLLVVTLSVALRLVLRRKEAA